MDNQSTEKFNVKVKVKINIYNIKLIITDVYYIKEMKNLIPMTKLIGKGFKVIWIKNKFIISNNGVNFEYSKSLETQNVYIVCLYSHSNIE